MYGISSTRKNGDNQFECLVTGLVPEELLPLLMKEAAVENGEDGNGTLRCIFDD